MSRHLFLYNTCSQLTPPPVVWSSWWKFFSWTIKAFWILKWDSVLCDSFWVVALKWLQSCKNSAKIILWMHNNVYIWGHCNCRAPNSRPISKHYGRCHSVPRRANYVTLNHPDPSVNWPMTHITRDPWPITNGLWVLVIAYRLCTCCTNSRQLQ